MIETMNDKMTVTDTVKAFQTRLPLSIIERIHAEAKQSGRIIERVVADILSAHYAEMECK